MYDLLLAAKNNHATVTIRKGNTGYCSIAYVVQATP
jgi:hypothetical protein